VSLPVRTIHKEEGPDTYAKGYDVVTDILMYDNVKTDCVKNGETFWVLNEIRKTVRNVIFVTSSTSGK
jgi:hypothetical protein